MRGVIALKLFSKDINPCCAYCAKSKKLNDNEAICAKHGIVSMQYRCRKYEYDPTKRVPPEPIVLDTQAFSADDFKID